MNELAPVWVEAARQGLDFEASRTLLWVVVAGAVLSLALLWWETARGDRPWGLRITGLVTMLFAAVSILRPLRVKETHRTLGESVAVLVDASRRMDLPRVVGETRWARAKQLHAGLTQLAGDRELRSFQFSEGGVAPFTGWDAPRSVGESDLSAALQAVSKEGTWGAVVVISDGRWLRPQQEEELRRFHGEHGGWRTPTFGLLAAEQELRDASIRELGGVGTAVAHEVATLRVTVGCGGGLACTEIPVKVRELRRDEEPLELASGLARLQGGEGTVELPVRLERAGQRVLEVEIGAQAGDVVPGNDRRYLTVTVLRDRIRILHVAGAPSYDVRALRRWLKGDEAIDVISFFILRSDADDPQSLNEELSLIPFPVDELFKDHLDSFDAVILQNIDAVAYGIAPHLPRLASYVERGGGLIMVGGPQSFAGGNYAGTPVADVLPVEVGDGSGEFDPVGFVPKVTAAGRVTPVLAGVVQSLADGGFPSLPGANRLGAAKPGAVILWEHPRRSVGKGRMPVLALREHGDGRSIALAADGTFRLGFSEEAVASGGRAYGALWSGLVGWLMRDPRYEAGVGRLEGDCIAGRSATLVFQPVGSEGGGELEVEVRRLGMRAVTPAYATRVPLVQGAARVPLPPLEEGGYSASARVAGGPPARVDFACEVGGRAWRDSRPDAERMSRLLAVLGGRTSARADELVLPEAVTVAVGRQSAPWAPRWLWSLLAGAGLGLHWLQRRRGGLR